MTKDLLGLSTPAIEVEELRTIETYRACSVRTLRRIRRISDVVTCAPGQMIHRPEFRFDWVYGVLDGTVAIESATDTRLASAGESVGLADALLGRHPVVQVSAVSVTTVLVASRTELLALAACEAPLALGLAKSVAHAP